MRKARPTPLTPRPARAPSGRPARGRARRRRPPAGADPIHTDTVDTYTTREVAELLGVTPARVRRFVRSGLLKAHRESGGYLFSFQDLVLLRNATELAAGDLSPQQVTRSLRRLKEQLPGKPLSAVRMTSVGGRIVAREGESVWEPASGQYQFELTENEPAEARSATELFSDELADVERTPEEWFEIGCDLESRSSAEARQAYAQALRLAPDHLGANLNLGRLLHEAGDLSAAEGHYRAALTAQHGNATAAFNLGVVLEDAGEVESAIESYLRAVAIDPDFADAHYNLSHLYERSGDRGAALRHLRSYGLLTKPV